MLIPAQQIADDIVLNLQTAQTVQDFVATGQAKASWQTVVREDRILIFGQSYIFQNWQGRRPGTPPPISAIRAWIRAKGLALNPWAVRAAIAKRGDRVYRREREGLKLLRSVEAAITQNKAEYERIMLFNIEQQLKAAWQSQ